MIGVIIPTRNNRPAFLNQAKKMLAGQTMQPDKVMIMDWVHDFESEIDLNWRYITGLNYLFNMGCGRVFLWEDDDYYSPEYIEYMNNAYEAVGCPDLFGLNTTTYYHLGLKRYAVLNHPNHSSAMSMIVSNRIFKYGLPDNCKYDFDIFYSKNCVNKKFITPHKVVNIGIKHGISASGTLGHKKEAKIYFQNTTNTNCYIDKDLLFLTKNTGKEIVFYKEIMNQL